MLPLEPLGHTHDQGQGEAIVGGRCQSSGTVSEYVLALQLLWPTVATIRIIRTAHIDVPRHCTRTLRPLGSPSIFGCVGSLKREG